MQPKDQNPHRPFTFNDFLQVTQSLAVFVFAVGLAASLWHLLSRVFQ